MKILSKLITTSMLLLIGALVSFGASLSEEEYNDLIRSTNAQELVEKLQTKERFNQFAKMAGEKNPEMAPQIQHYVEDHKGKHLKNLDRGQLQAVFQGAVPFSNEIPSADRGTKSKPKSREKSAVKPETKSKTNKYSKSKPKPKEKSNLKQETKSKTDKGTKSKPKSKEKSNVKPEAKSKKDKDVKSKPKQKKQSDAKVDKKTKTKAAADADAKKKAKKEAKSKAKSDSKAKKKKESTSTQETIRS